MSKYVFFFGTRKLNKFKRKLEHLISNELKVKDIYYNEKKSLVKFIYNNDEYVIKGAFGSKALRSKEFRGTNKIFLLGMCFGFKGINVSDYCLPKSFSFIEKLPKNFDINYKFKKSDVSDEIIINNTLSDFIKDRYDNVKEDARVITNAFGLFTYENVENLDFDVGEMESYLIAKLSKKLKADFGSLLICTDNDESTIIIYEITELIKVIENFDYKHELIKKAKEVISDERDPEKIYKKLSKDELNEFSNLWGRIRSLKPVIKFRDKMKEKNPSIFDLRIEDLLKISINIIKNIKDI